MFAFGRARNPALAAAGLCIAIMLFILNFGAVRSGSRQNMVVSLPDARLTPGAATLAGGLRPGECEE